MKNFFQALQTSIGAVYDRYNIIIDITLYVVMLLGATALAVTALFIFGVGLVSILA